MSDKKLSREERKRQIIEQMWPTRPPPKPVLAAPISERMAAAVKANPASVKVVAREETGAVLIERGGDGDGEDRLGLGGRCARSTRLGPGRCEPRIQPA